MNTEVFLALLCLVAIHLCNSIVIPNNDGIGSPLNGTGDGMHPTTRHTFVRSRSSTSSHDVTTSVPGGDIHVVSTQNYNDITDVDTGKHSKEGGDVTMQTAAINGQDEMIHLLNKTTVNNSKKNQHRATGLCSSLNPEQEFLCRQAVIADSKLDQIYKLMNNLVKTLFGPLTVQLASQEVDGDCSMNMSRLTSDLRTAITAVCLLDNVTETTEAIGDCCYSESHIGEEFHQFAEFLQTNVFQLLIKDYQMDTVEPICVGKNVNVIWLLSTCNDIGVKTNKVMDIPLNVTENFKGVQQTL